MQLYLPLVGPCHLMLVFVGGFDTSLTKLGQSSGDEQPKLSQTLFGGREAASRSILLSQGLARGNQGQIWLHVLFRWFGSRAVPDAVAQRL